MRRLTQITAAIGLLAVAAMAYAGPPVEGALEKQATNWHAIIMFCLFVCMTMGITYWASSRTKSTADFCHIFSKLLPHAEVDGIQFARVVEGQGGDLASARKINAAHGVSRMTI